VLTSGLLQLGFATRSLSRWPRVWVGVLQYLFPIAAVLTAVLIERRSLTGYLSFVIWLWMLTPLVRRLADLQSGWHEPSLILLAPYGATAYPAAREAMAAVVAVDSRVATARGSGSVCHRRHRGGAWEFRSACSCRRRPPSSKR
jgi:hypothetical protein